MCCASLTVRERGPSALSTSLLLILSMSWPFFTACLAMTERSVLPSGVWQSGSGICTAIDLIVSPIYRSGQSLRVTLWTGSFWFSRGMMFLILEHELRLPRLCFQCNLDLRMAQYFYDLGADSFDGCRYSCELDILSCYSSVWLSSIFLSVISVFLMSCFGWLLSCKTACMRRLPSLLHRKNSLNRTRALAWAWAQVGTWWWEISKGLAHHWNTPTRMTREVKWIVIFDDSALSMKSERFVECQITTPTLVNSSDLWLSPMWVT